MFTGTRKGNWGKLFRKCDLLHTSIKENIGKEHWGLIFGFQDMEIRGGKEFGNSEGKEFFENFFCEGERGNMTIVKGGGAWDGCFCMGETSDVCQVKKKIFKGGERDGNY